MMTWQATTDDVLEIIENPDFVLHGYRGSLIAARGYGRRRHLMVIYRQVSSDDGFIITAYFISRIAPKEAIWKRQ